MENQALVKVVSLVEANIAIKHHTWPQTVQAVKETPTAILVGTRLVATNWPIEKALHEIGYNQIPTK